MKWWKTPEKTRVENGVTLHAISPLFPMYSGKRRSISQGILFSLFCFNLIKESWDVIEVDHMPYFPLFTTKLVCLVKRKKMFATWNEVWGLDYWVRYMGFPGYISAFIERVSIFLPDVFISISQHTTNRLKLLYKVPDTQIKTISTGLDTSSIELVEPSKQKYDVIYAGRLWKHKNLPLLIDAMAEVVKKNKDRTCVIVGNGHEKIHLINKVISLGLEKNIFFENFMPHHDEVFGLMKSAKVFVLPSIREGFGMAVLEANACGIPAIVVKHFENAAVDLIEKDNGILINPNPKEMADAIEELITNRRDILNVKRVATKYNWEDIVDNLEKHYLTS
jgi:glycosyltransferase involved in cell wall biosynthesis